MLHLETEQAAFFLINPSNSIVATVISKTIKAKERGEILENIFFLCRHYSIEVLDFLFFPILAILNYYTYLSKIQKYTFKSYEPVIFFISHALMITSCFLFTHHRFVCKHDFHNWKNRYDKILLCICKKNLMKNFSRKMSPTSKYVQVIGWQSRQG